MTKERLSVLIVTPGLGRTNRGSFAQLADGMVKGLEANGVQVTAWDAPRQPRDASEALPRFDGVTTLIYCGPPVFARWVEMMFAIAKTRGIETLFILYANATTLPSHVVGFLRTTPIGAILTGSQWSASVLRSVPGITQPVHVATPGVDVGVPGMHRPTRPEWAHAVAGTTGRKGTEELLDAVGETVPLCIYTDATAAQWVDLLLAARGRPANVTTQRAYDRSEIPAWWAHELVVQPSRAEGLGLGHVEASLLHRCLVTRIATGVPEDLRESAFVLDEREGWEEWEGGDGVRAHPLGDGVRELTIADPADIAYLLRYASRNRTGRTSTLGDRERRAQWSHERRVKNELLPVLLGREPSPD